MITQRRKQKKYKYLSFILVMGGKRVYRGPKRSRFNPSTKSKLHIKDKKKYAKPKLPKALTPYQKPKKLKKNYKRKVYKRGYY
jgi:hypothetical protein